MLLLMSQGVYHHCDRVHTIQVRIWYSQCLGVYSFCDMVHKNQGRRLSYSQCRRGCIHSVIWFVISKWGDDTTPSVTGVVSILWYGSLYPRGEMIPLPMSQEMYTLCDIVRNIQWRGWYYFQCCWKFTHSVILFIISKKGDDVTLNVPGGVNPLWYN